jgi:hypothetical protein
MAREADGHGLCGIGGGCGIAIAVGMPSVKDREDAKGTTWDALQELGTGIR